ncbi:MAG TPA: hypothetical protein VGZ22_01795 [Isosphaeraceae bacterium]|nr:hypothetical protein [Isosphaeraceae bacterium]
MTSEPVLRTVPAAEATRTRKFGLSDGMCMIIAIALAISGGSRLLEVLAGQCSELCQTIAARNSPPYVGRPQFWWYYVGIYWSCMVWYAFRIVEVLILSLTPAFLLIRLRRPRPSIRAMLRQPGTVAGLAVVFGYVWVTGWLHLLFVGRIDFVTGPAIAVGGTVAVAWAFLALSRQWEAEPGWVDRMGRYIGAAAIAVGLLMFARYGI